MVMAFLLTLRDRNAAAATTLGDLRARLQELSSDVAGIEAMRADREFSFRELGPSDDELRARPNLPKKYSSSKAIAPEAVSLIVTCEVISRSYYERKLMSPIWPGGRSGVTFGIGYDLGYQTKEDLHQDWAGLLGQNNLDALTSACLVTAENAENLIGFFQDVSVSWTVARAQFDQFLKLVAGQTLNTFPSATTLGSLAFGALVSLIYNRGGQLKVDPKDPLDRRREMRAIRDLLAAGRIDEVPDQIRQMKRLWPTGQSGLLKRREAEATMFEVGLAS